MIAFIEGTVMELTPTSVILDVGGIGYEINITLADYSRLHDVERAKLRITEIIREDAYLLYGFIDEEARQFFERLRTVSGVGPATARLILSTFSPRELANVINAGSVELLQTVKGVGLKTAQRIVVDLKGKLVLPDDESSTSGANSSSDSQVAIEAQRALRTLGYSDANVKKVVKKILSVQPMLAVEEVIKHALKQL